MFKQEDFDTAIRPQDDFYHFANGGWLRQNPIPQTENRWGVFAVLRHEVWQKLKALVEELGQDSASVQTATDAKLRYFYNSAIDPVLPETAGMPYARKWLDMVDEISTTAQLREYFWELQAFGISAPWCTYVDFDDKDSSRYVLRLRQGGLGMPDRDYYFLDDPTMKKARELYPAHIRRMLELFGYANTDSIQEQAYTIEKLLAEASRTKTALRDIEAQYNKMSSAEFVAKYPTVGLVELCQQFAVQVPAEVIVDQPEFFVALEKAFQAQSLDAWKAYLRWHIVLSVSNYLGERIEQEHFAFYGKTLTGAPEIQPRWKRVVIQMDSAIGHGLGQKFVARYFPKEAKERMQTMVQDLKDAFALRIQKLTWMTDATKTAALEKLQKLNVKVGYPDKWVDYTNLEISEQTSYLENVFIASKFEVARELAKLSAPVDTGEWFMNPQTVNAYAYFNLLDVTFPAGILQPPFFDLTADNAENYGSIGVVIGHEISHHFDDKGSQFNAQGNMSKWWSDEDLERFTNCGKALKEQASAFHIFPDLQLNGQLTQGENIGDLGGLEIALDAFELSLAREPLVEVGGYTPRQRFFLSYARSFCTATREDMLRNQVLTDPHAPSIFRVNGILRNVDRFYDAFGVTEKDALYLPPEERVRIW